MQAAELLGVDIDALLANTARLSPIAFAGEGRVLLGLMN